MIIAILPFPGYRGAKFNNLSAAAKDLLLRLLERDPRVRATAAEVLKHPWICYMNELGPRPLDSDVSSGAKLVSSRRLLLGMSNCTIATTKSR